MRGFDTEIGRIGNTCRYVMRKMDNAEQRMGNCMKTHPLKYTAVRNLFLGQQQGKTHAVYNSRRTMAADSAVDGICSHRICSPWI